jgi:hypothetical protein
MSSLERINAFLDQIKSDGRSSPAGRHWNDFWKWLEKQVPNKTEQPAMPLILAASGVSDSTKHDRLREQLMFAERNGFAIEAIEWLSSLTLDDWNHGSESNWHKSFFD